MIKNNYIGYFLGLALALVSFASCSKDDTVAAKVAPSSAGVFTDTRDGQIYRWVRYGQLDWMADNFAYNVGSECSVYLEADEHETATTNAYNLAKYGRLYTQKGALEACPEGWRLPTDKDWQNLEQQLGMSASDAASRDWRGNISHSMFTVKDDSCALNLLIGGYYTTHTVGGAPGWRFMGAQGYYWTSTQDTEKGEGFYFYRRFFYSKKEVFRDSTEPQAYQMSVRYVRDAQ